MRNTISTYRSFDYESFNRPSIDRLPFFEDIVQDYPEINDKPNPVYNFPKNIKDTVRENDLTLEQLQTVQMWMNYIFYCKENGKQENLEKFYRMIKTSQNPEIAIEKEIFLHDIPVFHEEYKKYKRQQQLQNTIMMGF